ncbi:MAG TPA: hypothetical protein VLD60_13615, partial [Nitrospira sp.]|nr:hypothetical protein [Nitrospira sp.]
HRNSPAAVPLIKAPAHEWNGRGFTTNRIAIQGLARWVSISGLGLRLPPKKERDISCVFWYTMVHGH